MSSAARYAEQLIILCDHAQGLLCRLYQLVDYKRPPLFAKEGEIERFAKNFVKKFPEFPDTLNKAQGTDVFKKRAPEVVAALSDYYATFLDLIDFQEEAWRVLQEIASNLQEFKLELNQDILTYYFNLLSRYMSVHFLANLADSPQMFLASYAKAFHQTSGNTEASFGKVAKYIAAFKPNPLKKMQDDAVAISLCVGNTLMTFMSIISKYSNVAAYQNRLFGLLHEDQQTLTVPMYEQAQIEVTHLLNVRSWVLFGFLLCPAELARPGALDLLSLCLKETFLVPLFRDKCLNIHKEFDEQMDYKSASGGFKLAKHKKIFKDAYTDDEGTRLFHQQLRSFLRTEMEVANDLFQELPQCLPPKLHLIFALLCLARNEVVWYYRHLHAQPFKGSKKGLTVDPQISDLIHLVVQLSKMVENNREEIQQHYIQLLTKDDVDAAKQVVEPMLNQLKNPACINLVHLMIDPLADRKVGENLESIRLNWYRFSAAANHAQSGIPISSIQPFANLMHRIVAHTRNIDSIDTQLKAHASFQHLYYYKHDLQETLKSVLVSPEGRASHSLAFVVLLGNALHNIHRLCPDEQPMVGKDAVTTGDAFIRMIVQMMEKCVQGIINESAALRAKTNFTATVARIQRQNAMSNNPHAASLPWPGEESLYENRNQVANLTLYRRTLAAICSALTRQETIVLYNIEFVPREYVYEAISNSVRASIVNQCVQGPIIQKPSVILHRLQDVIYAFSAIEHNLAINVHDIIREVLLGELAPADEFQLGSPSSSSSSSSSSSEGGEGSSTSPRNTSVVQHIATFYAHMFSQDLAAHGIVYSSVKKCFMSKASEHSTNTGAGAVEFERYTDVGELRALATLLGPSGLNVIDRMLLRVLSKNFKVIKDCLLANQTVLLNLAGRFTEQGVWMDNVHGLQGLDALCAATTSIGCILHFRRLMRDALQEVTRQRMPFVLHAVQMAHNAVHEGGVIVSSQLAPIDAAASDVGIDVGEADLPLKSALAPFKTSVSDLSMFQYLPELYGLMYLSNRWRSASYSIAHDGHLNNNHCMALAIRSFLVHFNRMLVKDNVPPLDVERRICNDIERFIRCSAFTILHMRVLNSKESSSNQYPLHAIMIFLEQAIRAADGRIEMSVLESCFPFTMLRTNFIQMYEKQTNIHSYVPVDDAGD